MSTLNIADQSFNTKGPKLSTKQAGRDKKGQYRLLKGRRIQKRVDRVKHKVWNRQSEVRYKRPVVLAKASK